MKPSLVLALAAIAVLASGARGQDGMLYPPNTSSYVNVPSTPDLMPQGGLTVESWFYFNPAAPGGSNNPTILRKDPGSHPYILRTNSGGGGNLQWFVWTQTSGYSSAEVPCPQLSWHHAAGTYDGTTMRLYLDGVLVASVPKTGPLLVTSGPLKLGQGNAPDETWKGYIDEIRIWSVVRSQAQIQSTMLQRIDNHPGLVAAWHFDGNYLDLTGNHNGSPVGTPQILPATSPVVSVFLIAPPIVPIGGALPFQLNASPSPAPYILEISATGTTPGTPIPSPGTGVFPLNPPFLYSTYGGALPGTFQNFTGVTGFTGTATATLNVPALPQLIGVVVSSAFVVLDGGAPYGIGKISNAQQTTITDYGPMISAISPATSPTAGGWAVTISGSHFQQGATVTFDGAPATNVVVGSNSISCFTPPGALGPAIVLVHNPDGNETQSTNFSYVPTLTVTGTTPIVAGSGATMTVTGTGFTAGLTATLGGAPCAIGVVGPSSFALTIPQGTFCDAALVVSLPDMQSVTFNGVNPVPAITNVIGPPGLPSGGSSFLVLGSNFHPGTTMSVGGAPAVITSMTTTAIVATAPPGPSGPVQLLVTSAAGCGATSIYVYQ